MNIEGENSKNNQKRDSLKKSDRKSLKENLEGKSYKFRYTNYNSDNIQPRKSFWSLIYFCGNIFSTTPYNVIATIPFVKNVFNISKQHTIYNLSTHQLWI